MKVTGLWLVLALGSATVPCHAQEYTLSATPAFISFEPAGTYHTGGGSGGADVHIASTNSYSCINISGRTLSPYLSWVANVSIVPDPGNSNSGFSAPQVLGIKQVTLDNMEGWSLANVLAGTTGPLLIGAYTGVAYASLTEGKTGQEAQSTVYTGVTVEI